MHLNSIGIIIQYIISRLYYAFSLYSMFHSSNIWLYNTIQNWPMCMYSVLDSTNSFCIIEFQLTIIIIETVSPTYTWPCTRHLLKATVILVPLLGFTWIIGLFAVGAEGRVFAYLFVIANVFQVREIIGANYLVWLYTIHLEYNYCMIHLVVMFNWYRGRSYFCFMS